MDKKIITILKRKTISIYKTHQLFSNSLRLHIQLSSGVEQVNYRGGSGISGKSDHMYKGVGVRLADFFSFSYIPHENEIICSHDDRGRGGGLCKSPEPPLDLPLKNDY